ncbi:MAG: hypothetical protein K1X54_02740 [Flavobacteriales bacterium]|nr:hypothetical protein [Flavobacteriales bacterium]
MTSDNEKIYLEQPCPVARIRLTNKDGQSYCRSCHKTLVDFRDADPKEIKSKCNQDTCGIFYSDQIVTPTFNTTYKIKFYILTLLSVLGMNVTPLRAQKKHRLKPIPPATQQQIERDKEHPNPPANFTPVNPHQKNKSLRKPKRRKKPYITYGCPSF